MPIICAKNHVEEFAARAKYFPPWSMAARRSEDTLVVARKIVEYIGKLPEGTILDVGCGDGALLHLLSGNRIGVAPSREEVGRLRSLWPDVRFEVAMAQSLPLPDTFVSVLICNSVLLALETEDEVRKALAEFSRLCRPGALVFLGEIPTEPVRVQYRHDSVSVWLWSLLTRGGPKNFLAGVRDVTKAAFTDTPLLFYPERYFHCSREQFIAMVQQSGFALVKDRATPHPVTPRTPVRRDYLYAKRDYLFTKHLTAHG